MAHDGGGYDPTAGGRVKPPKAKRKPFLEAVAEANTPEKRRALARRVARTESARGKDEGPTLQEQGLRAERGLAAERERRTPAQRHAAFRRWKKTQRGQADTSARASARKVDADAASLRKTTTGLVPGAKALPKPAYPWEVASQAAGWRASLRQDAADRLDPDRLAVEIKMRARDESPDAIAKAASELETAGVPADAITRAINALDKKPKSPALEVLSQFTRPISAVAGATRAAYTGEDPVLGAIHGFVHNDQSFSDVLADVGAPEWAQTVGGLALDIALDPTTYITLGGTVPAKVAAKGAEMVALKAGARADEALDLARKVYEAHPSGPGRGVQVGFRGVPVKAISTARGVAAGKSLREARATATREVKTSGATTAKYVGTPLAAAAKGARNLPGAGKVLPAADRARVELVNSARPAGVHPIDFDHVRAAARKYRAARGAGERLTTARVKAYSQLAKANNIGPAGLNDIAFALDAGDLSHLAAGERALAVVLQRDLAGVAQREIQAGVRSTDAVVDGYWPRVMREIADAQGFGSGGKRVTGTSFKARTETRTFEEMGPEQAARFVTDDLSPVARRLGDSGRALALNVLHQDVAALGPRVRSLAAIDDVGGTLKTTYIRDGKGYKPLWREGESFEQTRAKVEVAIKAGTEVRAVPQDTFELAFEQAHRGKSGAGTDDGVLGRGFDKVQGNLKTLQTVVNPGYHVTNLLGDLFNARLGGATFAEIKGAARQVRLERKLDAFNGDLAKGIEDLTTAKLTHGGKTETYGANGKLTDADVVDMAREYGAIQTGFAGTELHALQRVEATKAYRVDKRFVEAARHANEIREDVIRLVSFRSALKRGMDPASAAAHTAAHHFDYSDLTEAERRFARRAIPFYTFWRHNTPLQARSLVKSPGRYATVEKTRDATADASGLDEDFALGLPAYVQQQTPFAVPGIATDGLPIGVNLKLPLSDLNSIDPRGWPDELAQRISVLAKMPAEQWAKYDFFFKDKIRKDFVPAPSWATNPNIKAIIEDATGSKIKMIYDRRSGKMVPGWSWRVDKIVRLLPITGALANVTTPGKSQHAKGALAAAGYVLGPRPFALDPVEAKTQQLFETLDNLEGERDALKQTVRHRSGERWRGKVAEIGREIAKTQKKIAALDASDGFDSPRFSRKRSSYGVGSYGGKSRYGGASSTGYGGKRTGP